MKPFILAALTLLALAGCAAPPYPGTQAMGTVTGRVLSWPCAPVENVNSPCPGRPAPGVQLDFTQNGNTVGSALTDSTGTYSIQLLPGTYVVTLRNVRILRSPNRVTVTGGQVTNADFVFDNGIRLPVVPNG